MQPLTFDSNTFLTQHWQKKPAVFRGAFSAFEDILDEHDLAGLAQEEDVDSRLIRNLDNTWLVECGPIADFDTLCQGNWTLLVQGVENYLDEAQALLDQFRFIPKWRTDDLMVSFSVPDAGVGPHLDQYDVFIIQGKGRRRWQIGEPGNFQEHTPHPQLRQITGFTPTIDVVLEPGDMIYIPPGHPHDGIALENCMNYSVGFRADTQQELLSSFCDHLIDEHIEGHRYSDPDLQLRPSHAEIKQQEVQHFRHLLLQMINSEQFPLWLGEHLSENPKFLPEDCGEGVTEERVLDAINQGAGFYRSPGLHYLHLEPLENAQDFQVFVQGERYIYPNKDTNLVTSFLNSPEWHPESKNYFKNSSLFIQNLTTLVKRGYWTLID